MKWIFQVVNLGTCVTIYTPLFVFHVGFDSPWMFKDVIQDIMWIGLLPNYNIPEGELIPFKWYKCWVFKEVTFEYKYNRGLTQ